MGLFTRKKGGDSKKDKSSFKFPLSRDDSGDSAWPTLSKLSPSQHHRRAKSYNGGPISLPPGGVGDPVRLAYIPKPSGRSPQLLDQLPSAVLQRIFTFVCPHTQDTSYETNELSALSTTCMLCDLRDLSNCGKTCKKWRSIVVPIMYHSIRIDRVHYCWREAVLAEERKRGHFLERNADPKDPARVRLMLLSRTVREDPTRLGKLVNYLKTPYMLREAAGPDLARTIAVMPNLKYVDLPEGMFSDSPANQTLRLEVQARCPGLRRMAYYGGSEQSLAQLASGNIWSNLETLELRDLQIDPLTLRHALGRLTRLRALKVTNCPAFADDFFQEYDGVPPLPCLAEFMLINTPLVTAHGICSFLARVPAKRALKVLALTSTGIKTDSLHHILSAGIALHHLSIVDVVDMAFPNPQQPVPTMTSRSLHTLHYEITASSKAGAYASSACQSHYAYLAESIMEGGLPNLQQLYVRDAGFPELLLGLPPSMPNFSDSSSPGFRQRAGSAGVLPAPRTSMYLNRNTMGPGGPPPAGVRGHRPSGSFSNSRFGPSRLQNNNPFTGGGGGGGLYNIPAQLEIFTKTDDNLDWSVLQMAPAVFARQQRDAPESSNVHAPATGGGPLAQQAMTGSVTGDQRSTSASRTQSPHHAQTHRRTGSRPISAYGLGADIMGGGDTGWGSGVSRRSVMVGDGSGGFLQVPTTNGGSGAGDYGGDNGSEVWPGGGGGSGGGIGGPIHNLRTARSGDLRRQQHSHLDNGVRSSMDPSWP